MLYIRRLAFDIVSLTAYYSLSLKFRVKKNLKSELNVPLKWANKNYYYIYFKLMLDFHNTLLLILLITLYLDN